MTTVDRDTLRPRCNGRCQPGNHPRIPHPHVIADPDCPMHGDKLEADPYEPGPPCRATALSPPLIFKQDVAVHPEPADDAESLDGRVRAGLGALQKQMDAWRGADARAVVDTPDIRHFNTGACRDTDHNKIDPEGFLSPTVIRAYSEYMQANRTLPDGSVRASDNWAAGFPLDVYMKSLWRHFLDVWTIHRGVGADVDIQEALCGVLFNAMGYLHETLKDPG